PALPVFVFRRGIKDQHIAPLRGMRFTCRFLLVFDVSGEGEGKDASLAGDATHRDLPTLSFHKMLGQSESEPGSLIGFRHAAVELLKCGKESRQICRVNADASVLNLCGESILAMRRHAHGHRSPLWSELDSIGKEVQEDLFQLGNIQINVRYGRVEVKAKVQL